MQKERLSQILADKQNSFESQKDFEEFLLAEGLEVLSVYRSIADRQMRFSLKHIMNGLAKSSSAGANGTRKN